MYITKKVIICKISIAITVYFMARMNNDNKRLLFYNVNRNS